MPNPFDEEAQVSNDIAVTDSELWCQTCWAMSDSGWYRPDKKQVWWKCPLGHMNVVDMDLD